MTFTEVRENNKAKYPHGNWKHLAVKDSPFVVHVLVDDSFVVGGYVEDESGEIIDFLTNMECDGGLLGGMFADLPQEKQATYA